MKVLVTGASGGLGRYVVGDLAPDYELILFSRTQPAEDVLGRHAWVQGDLCDFDAVRRAMEGVEAVQHLGAQPNPTDHPRVRQLEKIAGLPFDQTIKSNVLGTYYVMRAAVDLGVRAVVMAGSNCALGAFYRISDTPFPIRYLPIDEEHPSSIEDTYSFTKLAAEEMLAAFTRAYGIRTYVTRLGGIKDEQERLQLAQRVKPVQKWYDGMWTWVSAEDCASAHRMLMEAALDEISSLPPHDVYFVNAADTYVPETSMELIERLRPDLLQVMRRRLEGHESFISTAKLTAAVGWRHRIAWPYRGGPQALT